MQSKRTRLATSVPSDIISPLSVTTSRLTSANDDLGAITLLLLDTRDTRCAFKTSLEDTENTCEGDPFDSPGSTLGRLDTAVFFTCICGVDSPVEESLCPDTSMTLLVSLDTDDMVWNTSKL